MNFYTLFTHPKMDPVNRPSHYEEGRTISPLAILNDWRLDYYCGNMLKYLARWRRKNGVQDLQKLRWYAIHCMQTWDALHADLQSLLLKVTTYGEIPGIPTKRYYAGEIAEDWKLEGWETQILIYIWNFNRDGDTKHLQAIVDITTDQIGNA